METEALLHPRGPLPPGVYWRRRALLVLGVVLLALVLRSCVAGGDGDDRLATTGAPATPTAAVPSTPAPTTAPATPSVTPSPSPRPTATPGPPQPCRPADLQVTATTDSTVYPAGVRPRLMLLIRNIGRVPCTRDVGQGATELRVISGPARVWSSDDCSPRGASEVVLLQPRATRSFPVLWSRRTSQPGCPAARAVAKPGTYRVVGRLGDIVKNGTVFFLR